MSTTQAAGNLELHKMDFDPTSTANSAQVALYAMQSQQADRSAATAPPPSPRLAARANTSVRQRPTTYHDLPPEILQQVADHMPFDDIGNLSTVDRRTYHALQERRLSRLCCQRAADATRFETPEGFLRAQQLLAEIERIHDPMLRAEPLRMLANCLITLPEERQQQKAAFQQVFEAAGRVPKQGLQIQKRMIKSIPAFSGQGSDLYAFAYADAERRRPEQGSTWAALASILGWFPPTESLQFETEYRAFVNRLPALNPAEQAELLAELAARLPDPPSEVSWDPFPAHYPTAATIAGLYETLTQWVQRLPASHRGAPINALFRQIDKLPKEQQTAAFQKIFEAAGHVPKEGLLIQKKMIGSIVNFPGQRSALYAFAYADAERRRPGQGSTWTALASVRKHWSVQDELPIDPPQFATEYRAFVSRLPALSPAEQAELIVELAELLIEFNVNSYATTTTTVAELYETLTQWVQHMPASHRGAPIGALAEKIWLLSQAQRPVHYANLRHLMLSLPDHELGKALRYLSSAVANLPSTQQAHELSRLEPIIERVLPEQRALVVLGLINSTGGLNEALVKQVWQRALNLLDSSSDVIQRMPPEQRVSMGFELIQSTKRLDEALSRQVWRSTLRAFDNYDVKDVYDVFWELQYWDSLSGMPDQQWEDAKTEISAFIERNRNRLATDTCDYVLQLNQAD
ncbi:F-box protein [Mycetohabitans sp. B8]|uniref:F-box protein n=1 Tax=Mycetohabitans sp. B8 TaxID=2841845 RepID=UPI001F3F0C95|nr:F-box protein [Mycetohabitans sp. B8]MCG1041942.1 F-box protein [Mycetohabitans sp. B8]